MKTQTSQHSRFRHPTILFFFFEESINDSFVSPYETRVSIFFSRSDNLVFTQVPGTALPTATSGSNCSTTIQYLNRAVVLYWAIPAWKSTVQYHTAQQQRHHGNNGGERGVPQCRRIWGTAPATHHDRSLEVISLALQPTRFHVLFCSPVVGLSQSEGQNTP